jgi:serine/threonine protein phosphatase 1
MKLTINNLNNTFVIGDVHGCFHTLQNLIKKLPSNANLIFVGDLCDRGFYTKEVIELIIANNYHCVLGNHDDYMNSHIKECMDNEALKIRWNDEDYMGGEHTLLSYKDDYETMLKHIQWIKTIPRYIECDNYFITHGFCLPYYKKRDEERSNIGLLKNRMTDKEDWGQEWEEGWEEYDIINIFGHCAFIEVEIGKNYYGIDTGCAYGRKLTAIQLGTMKIFEEQVVIKDILL